jgi:hypothetical protein
MKPFIVLVAFVAVVLQAGCESSQQVASQSQPSSTPPFYDQMSPYGSWMDYHSYGPVWKPNVGRDFVPYASSGRWVFTDAGWTWDSDYPWGWAAFHYGRWDYDDVYGWLWVPDEVWGPAWVSWRRAPGYYGWTPLRPYMGYRDGVGLDYHERDERWIVVRDEDLARADIGRYYVDRSRNREFIGGSRVITNTRRDNGRNATYIAGPELPEVQRYSPTRVEPVVIRDADHPGQRLGNGEYQIYRPRTGRRDASVHPPAQPVQPVAPNPADNPRVPEARDQRQNPVRPPETTQPIQLPVGKRSDAEDRRPAAPVVTPAAPTPTPTPAPAPATVRPHRNPDKVRPVDKVKPVDKPKPAEKPKADKEKKRAGDGTARVRPDR